MRIMPFTQFFESHQIIKLIALGSSSEVIRIQNEMGQTFIMKHLLNPHKHLDWAQQALYREGKILQRIQHPNLIPCYDIICDASGSIPIYLLLFKDVKAVTIRQLLDQINRSDTLYLSPLIIAYLLEQIHQALYGLHHDSQGIIIHNDLSPSNLLLDSSAQLYLTDLSSASTPYSPTQSKSYKSKNTYCAPERITHGKGSIASDYFAWGHIAFELITGHRWHSNLLIQTDKMELKNIDTQSDEIEKEEDWVSFYQKQAVKHQWPESWSELVFNALHPKVNKRLQVSRLLQKGMLWKSILSPSQIAPQNLEEIRQEAQQALAHLMRQAFKKI